MIRIMLGLSFAMAITWSRQAAAFGCPGVNNPVPTLLERIGPTLTYDCSENLLNVTPGTTVAPAALAAEASIARAAENAAAASASSALSAANAAAATANAALPTTGGTVGALTVTGPVSLPADPALPLQAATKQYVDVHAGSGPTLTTFNGSGNSADTGKPIFLVADAASGTVYAETCSQVQALLGVTGTCGTIAIPATSYTSALSAATEVSGGTTTLTLTPAAGDAWPAGETLTPVATGVAGSFSPATITPSGTTPAVFTFTASGGAATGTLTASASPSMTNTTGPLADAVTAAPVTATISSATIAPNGLTLTLQFSEPVTLAIGNFTTSAGTFTNADGSTLSATHVLTLASAVAQSTSQTYTTTSTAFTSPALTAAASNVAITNNSTVAAGTHSLTVNGVGNASTTVAPGKPASLMDMQINVGTLPSGQLGLITADGGNSSSLGSGIMSFLRMADGTVATFNSDNSGTANVFRSTVAAPTSGWLRVTFDVGNNATFYTSSSPVAGTPTWTQLGSPVAGSGGLRSSFLANAVIGIRAITENYGASNPAAFAVNRAIIIQDGTTVLDIDFTNGATSETTQTAAVGGAVTINSPAVEN